MKVRTTMCAALVLGIASSAHAHFTEFLIYVLDGSTDSVVQVNPFSWQQQSIIDSTVSGVNGARGIAFDEHLDMLVASQTGNHVTNLFSNTFTGFKVAEAEDGVSGPISVAVDGYNWRYIGSPNQILRMRHDHLVEMVFADGADGLVNPTGMEFLPDGAMLVANNGSGGDILMIDAAGTASVWDNIPGEEVYDITIRDNDDVYVSCDSGNIYRYFFASPANRVLLGTYELSPKICMDIAYSMLFVGSANGLLEAVDCETGASLNIINTGFDIRDLGVPLTSRPKGSFNEFGGYGIFGSGSIKPEIHGADNPRIGGSVRIGIDDFIGFSVVHLLSSMTRGSTPFAGSDISVGWPWVDTQIQVGGNPGVPGEGDWDFYSIAIPNDPLLVGSICYMQGLAMDPGAIQGWSMTPGLLMTVGL